MKLASALFALVPAIPVAAAQPADTIVNHSLIAFTIPEKDLIPENVAYDPVTQAFFVGSVRKGKIVRVGPDGAVSDFIAPRAHGLWGVLGMKVDASRRRLWVASTASATLVDYTVREGRPSGLFVFDLDSGEPRGSWTRDIPGETYLFNDVAVLTDGTVYVTNSISDPVIYRLRDGAEDLEVFAISEGHAYLNGLTPSADERYLYVAHGEGIDRFDLASGERVPLSHPEGVTLGGVDGLYLHDGSLIAMQDGVRRFRLDSTGTVVTGVDVIEAGHPMFSAPTTGVLVGDTLFYLANSQFDRIRDGFPPLDRLYEVVVLKVAL